MAKRHAKPAKALSPPRHVTRVRPWIAIVLIGGAVVLAILVMRPRPPAVEMLAPTSPGFLPTVENKNRPSGDAPNGMVWIPGGEFSMGAQDPPDMHDAVGMQATTDSRPIHRVFVDAFWMDGTEVTNEQFAAFVKSHRIRHCVRARAACRGLSGRGAGELGRRVGSVFASQSSCSTDRRTRLVVLRPRRDLASSVWPCKFDSREGTMAGRSCGL